MALFEKRKGNNLPSIWRKLLMLAGVLWMVRFLRRWNIWIDGNDNFWMMERKRFSLFLVFKESKTLWFEWFDLKGKEIFWSMERKHSLQKEGKSVKESVVVVVEVANSKNLSNDWICKKRKHVPIHEGGSPLQVQQEPFQPVDPFTVKRMLLGSFHLLKPQTRSRLKQAFPP